MRISFSQSVLDTIKDKINVKNIHERKKLKKLWHIKKDIHNHKRIKKIIIFLFMKKREGKIIVQQFSGLKK